MSRWRQKGFVLDSDEEEEESQIESQGSRAQGSLSGRADRVEGDTGLDPGYVEAKNGVSDIGQHEGQEAPMAGGANNIEEQKKDSTTPTRRTSPKRPSPSPFTPCTQYDLGRAPTESPGPLQLSPAPMIQRNRPPASSQRLGSILFPRSSAVDEMQERYDGVMFSQAPGSATVPSQPSITSHMGYTTNISNLLDQFGISPLSDDSDALSDPPSDMESPPVAFIMPHRRTAVQVLIPSSTALQVQMQTIEEKSNRDFRQRKPIQLHPYALEGELYRREVQSRGLKPVPRARSPQRQQAVHGTETQEQEFDPNEAPSSSPPELEIPVSTPVVHRPSQFAQRRSYIRRTTSDPASRPLPTQLHLPHVANKRRLNPSLTQNVSAPTRSTEGRDVRQDIWSIPPNSPPYSSSPLRSLNGSVRRLSRTRGNTPMLGLPTPTTSSVFHDDLQPLPECDTERVLSSAQISRDKPHRSATIVLSDNSSSKSDSSSESGQADNDLRKVGRKIKGVLPASWLRFDRQAQEQRRAPQLRRDRAPLNVDSPPGPTEPPRGVAQRVTKCIGPSRQASAYNTPSKEVLVVSDDSDNEIAAPITLDQMNTRRSIEDASVLAAMLDTRYSNHDLSDMEDDRLHLPILGGIGLKRKKQSRLTDSFPTRKKVKSSAGVIRPVGLGKRSYGNPSSRNKTRSRLVRSTPPPALSIIDLDLSPSKCGNAVPQFIKIARRQALQRPDRARQSPNSKHIRLHIAQDTEDANVTLQQWRQGTLKQTRNSDLRRYECRQPLVDRDDNQQMTQKQLDTPDNSTKDVDRSSAVGTCVSSTRRRRNLPLGLHILQRVSSSTAKLSQRSRRTAQPRGNAGNRSGRDSVLFRTAQLEGDEKNFGRDHRKIAFEKGLRRVDQQSRRPLAQDQRHSNPQLARFLADNDMDLSPSPLPKDTIRTTKECASKQANPGQDCPKRKSTAQRIDIDAREYRQPSEPAVHDIVCSTVVNNTQGSEIGQESLVLQGLGPYGTRYPVGFDVSSLDSGTYFHSTTFIGSEDLRRALTIGQPNSRTLDEAAGYFTINHGTYAVRCGPWNDETYSRLYDLTRVVLGSSEDQTVNFDLPTTMHEESLVRLTEFLRSLIVYISGYLSFLDPVDREDFVSKLAQLSQIIHSIIAATHAIDNGQGPASSKSRNGIRALSYLLVMNIQVQHIAKYATIGPIQVDLSKSIQEIITTITSHVARHGIHELSSFLEENKRYKARENGVQEAAVLVESTIICMHASEILDIPRFGFWKCVSQALCLSVSKATHIATFETMWATVFTLLPFVEVNISGLVTKIRRETFQADDWTCIRDLLKRLFELYASTYKKKGTSLNDYVRATLTRCHKLITYWHWEHPESMLNSVFDFFGKNGLKQLRYEGSNASVSFLESLATEYTLTVQPNENAFHVALKCLALGLRGMRNVCTEKRIRSFVFRTIPNHGRVYPKDQPLDGESLVALRNHHDLLSTLYWAAPRPCRPKLDHIQDLVNHESSHREACRLNVRAWANLTTFQMSTEEPYMSAKPFALWLKEIMHQTMRQYRLATTEADEYLRPGVVDGTTDVSAIMVRQTMQRNQEQVIATLRDCIAGMRKAVQHARDQTSSAAFLVDSDIINLLELPHLEDHRLVHVIRDTLELFREYVVLLGAVPTSDVSENTSEESQDYGDFPDIDDMEGINDGPSESAAQPSGLHFVQTPLWHLLSNAFGAESSPDDNFLMDCIDTWVLVAQGQVTSGMRSWSYYLDSFSQVSWNQLRQTEQTRKFSPYFMAALVTCSGTSYEHYRQEFVQALLLCLVERESMLRFQYRLLLAIARTDNSHPLVQNLPFFHKQQDNSWDITAETVRTRRLALISSMLSNMRDHVRVTSQNEPGRSAEVKTIYAAMLKKMMGTMKHNYQQLKQGTTVTGSYVEFVQKVIQFLKQYTGDICPVLPFFTDSVAFPLPATDPTYVVGRLCSYAPKGTDPGTAKQLSVFIQTVAQQAAADNQQMYLVSQLSTAICSKEAPPADIRVLRSVLLHGIFPAYIEEAVSSNIAFIIARPILQSLPSILNTLIFDLRITQSSSVLYVAQSILSISHAFIRGTEQLKVNSFLFQQPHVLLVLVYMLEAITSILPLLEYISSQTTAYASDGKPSLVKYVQDFSFYAAERIRGTVPHSVPSYDGDAHSVPSEKPNVDLLAFSRSGLIEGMKANWSESGGIVWFGQGNARREVVFDIESVEEERGRLISAMEAFKEALRHIYGNDQYRAEDEREYEMNIVV